MSKAPNWFEFFSKDSHAIETLKILHTFHEAKNEVKNDEENNGRGVNKVCREHGINSQFLHCKNVRVKRIEFLVFEHVSPRTF